LKHLSLCACLHKHIHTHNRASSLVVYAVKWFVSACTDCIEIVKYEALNAVRPLKQLDRGLESCLEPG
jgi:hypothetical protein